MNTLFFIAYLGFMILWFFVHIPKGYQRGAKFLIQRNPGWLRDHPDVLAKIRNRKLATWICYALGAGMISLLIMAASSKRPPETMSGFVMLSVFVIVFIGLVEASRVSRYFKLIPPPDNREVDLLRKGMGDFVPMPLVYGLLFMLIGCLTLYLYAFTSEIIDTRLAYQRIVGVSGILLLAALIYISLFHRSGYRRVPPEFQKIESYGLVFVLFGSVLVGLWRIANDFFGTLMVSEIWVTLGISILLQFAPFIYRFNDGEDPLAEQDAEEVLIT